MIDVDWFIPYDKPAEKGAKHGTVGYREKQILVDGKSSFRGHLTNIYDVDVSNSFEVEFLVFSSQSRSIQWIKRDRDAVEGL